MGWVARYAGPLWVALSAAACEPLPPRSLSDVDFPEGIRLDTHQDVSFAVDLAGAPPSTWISVRLPSGAPLYEGEAALVTGQGLVFRLPAGVTELHVSAPGPDGVLDRAVVPVDGAAAVTYVVGS